MCAVMEEIKQEGRKEGREEGREEGRAEATANLVYRYLAAHRCGFDEACSILGLTQEEKDSVKKIIGKTGIFS